MRRPRRRVGEHEDVVNDTDEIDARAVDADVTALPTLVFEVEQPTTNGGAPAPRARLGELLVGDRVVSRDQLEQALLEQTDSGLRLGELLVRAGVVDEHQLTRVLATQFAMPLADLRRERPDSDALGALPETLVRSLQAIPLRRVDGVLVVVVGDPAHPNLRAELARATGGPVELLVAPASDVQKTIDQSYRALAGIAQHVKEFEITSAASRVAQGAPLQHVVDATAPVVQVVNLIITQALRDRASDVHIEPQGEQVRVRMRIDGALHDALTLPADMAMAIVSRIKVMAGMNIVERRRAQDGQIETDGRRARARHPRLVHSGDLRREDRPATARQEPVALQARRARHARDRRTRCSRSSCDRRSAW